MSEREIGNQAEFWNGEHGEAWARYTEIVDFMFRDFTAAILDAANIGTGDRVLDLGCGGGGTTMEIARRVTAVGSVTAVDVSAPMIEVARRRADAANLSNVTVVLGDAAAHPFAEAAFDALVSRLGCMFFADPTAAFSRLKTAIVRDGIVSLGVWRQPRENLWAMEPVSAAREFLDMPPRPGPEDPGPFAFADPDRVRRVLGEAGLRDIDIARFDFRIPMGRNFDEALAFAMEMGPLSRPLAAVVGEKREKAVAAISEVLKKNTDPDGIVRLAAASWIVTARAP
jgi:SAM-dependent methyltransferase